ncbi:hypothetical protein Hanom_Chr01g00086991 [Helianthus anomalus]
MRPLHRHPPPHPHLQPPLLPPSSNLFSSRSCFFSAIARYSSLVNILACATDVQHHTAYHHLPGATHFKKQPVASFSRCLKFIYSKKR